MSDIGSSFASHPRINVDIEPGPSALTRIVRRLPEDRFDCGKEGSGEALVEMPLSDTAKIARQSSHDRV